MFGFWMGASCISWSFPISCACYPSFILDLGLACMFAKLNEAHFYTVILVDTYSLEECCLG